MVSIGPNWMKFVILSKRRVSTRPLCKINEALKVKLLWRFAQEDGEKCDQGKYGVDNSYGGSRVHVPMGLVGLKHFKSFVEVKNGSRVLFWHDVWCANRPLEDQ